MVAWVEVIFEKYYKGNQLTAAKTNANDLPVAKIIAAHANLLIALSAPSVLVLASIEKFALLIVFIPVSTLYVVVTKLSVEKTRV